MIYYRPTDGGPHGTLLPFRPRTCFLMTQMSRPIPPVLTEIRSALKQVLKEQSYTLVDADSSITGRDFLLKIWEYIISVPLGVAIIHEEMRTETIANIFYEVGMMQSYGKETLVIKTPGATMPSDFVRTEHIQYGSDFKPRMRRFLRSLHDRASYYSTMAEHVERNPLLSIDFLRRAYLLNPDTRLRDRAREFFNGAGLEDRAKNSVETMLVNF
ncbi:hypothetical protein [Longimicrobium sp.]|uniref:hypothetical protein n=1 Tax=Longimicrobium sp. TaxID=2029185 RepID=UPI003B3B1ABF